MRVFMRKAITATATFSVALGIGFVMQYGDALAARLVGDAALPDAVAAGSPTTAQAVPDDLRVAQHMAILADVPGVDLSGLDATGVESPMPAARLVPVADTCAPRLTATAQDRAMVQLTLDADCHASAPVTIHHRGMMFSALTDADGHLRIDVPALARDALFVVDLGGGRDLAAAVRVPDADSVTRAVLQWQGEDGVQLHALEFGADYNEAGHVWAANVGAAVGQGGLLTVLGDTRRDNALRAEVYTFPAGRTAADGAVRLTVEAEITQGNCGRAVSAQSIRIAPGSDPVAVDLTMTMPDCDAVGEFLVLNNMFEDLTLAMQ